jgi:hypothetical protein
MSPKMRDRYHGGVVRHDPFKSDLWSLGVTILVIYLTKIKHFSSEREVNDFLKKNADEIEKEALKHDINRYFLI